MNPRSLLPWLNRLFVLLAGLVAVSAALTRSPRPYGDAPEYLLMAESLANHGSPDLQDQDLESLRRRYLGSRLEPPEGKPIGYYEADDYHRYSYHFWAYSLMCLPAKYLLRALQLDELAALQLTNALLMTLTLVVVVVAPAFTETQKLLLNGLLFCSPAVWFVLWPHPEVFSFSFAAMALVFMHRQRWRTAILLAAVASLQNPQLALLAAFLWLNAVVRLRTRCGEDLALVARARWRDGLSHALPALPIALHPLFFYVHFGTFSVVAREATSFEKLSLSRALDLLLDLNLGLLPYIPVALLAYLFGVARSALVKRRLSQDVQLFVLFAVLLLVNTLQWNFNHGTSGPSRYVVWMLPFVFFTLAADATRRGQVLTLVLAIAVQAGVVRARGGLVPRYDYLEHSAAAAFVLDHAPWLYNPDYEVFIKRTLHVEGRPTQGPYAYLVDGRCRKVLANRTHEEQVRSLCGFVPEAELAFFRKQTTRKSDRKAWKYLNY